MTAVKVAQHSLAAELRHPPHLRMVSRGFVRGATSVIIAVAIHA